LKEVLEKNEELRPSQIGLQIEAHLSQAHLLKDLLFTD